MESFLLGAAGAAGALLTFGVGTFAGWSVRKRIVQRRGTPPSPAEEETRRLREDQEAFQRLLNYNMEDAYGLGDKGGAKLE